MGECLECQKRGKTWSGSEPRCAFIDGVFSGDNWNCATMNKLRSLSYDKGFSDRDDGSAASIGVLHIPETDNAYGWLVMSWYKSRGTTGKAIIMCDDEEPEVLTIKHAESIIRSYEEIIKC
jgi:hypothetical protein